MPEYQAPLRDQKFILNELLFIQRHYQTLPGCEEVSNDLIEAILEEASKFATQVLQPINASGDAEGCHFDQGTVTTPKGFKAAYEQFRQGGWSGMTFDTAFGGQGLPYSLGIVTTEMISSANMSWGMYPGLTQGAIEAIQAHGTDAQKQTFLPKLIEGEWTGTMCLTEAHCGSDLGLIKTSARPNDDGTFTLNGSKIFISAGDHDLSTNIIHLVLARLPGAPTGTKGISLFIVPKLSTDNLEANGVSCGSIEHKMGINGSSTCVINFDDARGVLIGPENRGLNCMFTMMNIARMGTAMQGLAVAEASYQGALDYARNRIQGRALSGAKNPDKAADPLLVHADVRRMLLTCKSLTEANRALAFYTATLVDNVQRLGDGPERDAADLELGFLTPICKGFFTESGFEATHVAQQVFGGHGYVKEWGMEQLVRDARITTIYEGTTGIQALDLLGRKLLGNRGKALKLITAKIQLEVDNLPREFSEAKTSLQKGLKDWNSMTRKIGSKAMKNADEVGAASYDFLMFSGYLCAAWQWAKMVNVAAAATEDSDGFYAGKIATAHFYFDRILPRIRTHKACMLSGVDNLLTLKDEQFHF